MEKKKRKSAVQRNWLRMASFFLLFAILSNMLYIPCYFYVRNITRSNALEYYQQKLDDGVRSLDTSLIALSNLQTLLNQDALFRMIGYVRNKLDPASLVRMRNSVRAYLLPYDMVAETGLAMDEDILFTRTRIYYQREQLTVDKYFSCKGSTTADYVRNFSGSYCVLPAMAFKSVDYGSYDAFTVAWRWSRANDIYLFSTFPLKNVYALMADKGVLSSGCVSIRMGDTLIASSGTPLTSDCEVLTAKTSAVLMTVSVQIPNSYIEQDLKQLLRIVQIFLISVALATAVWIAVCAIAAARPLNRITDALYNSKHVPNENGGKGSLSDLADWIKKLDSRLTNYEDIIAAQQENLRVHTLEKALYQGFYKQESREAFLHAYPSFPNRWRMALLQYGHDETGLDDSRLTLLLTECLLKEFPDAILLPTGSDTLLVILAEEDGEGPARTLEGLRSTMQARYGLLFSFTLSDSHDDPNALAAAYQQMEYESNALFTAPDASRRDKPPLTLQQLQTMYMALSCGDETECLSILESAAPLCSEQDFFLAKHTYQMIANMLVTVKLESPCDLSDIPIPSFSRGEIRKMYTEELPNCLRRIAGRIAKERRALTQDLDQSILSFINTNLGNPLLCISMVTDKFQISAPTLQKRLHAVTAKTFSAYVEDARMNKARQELRETDRTVQEISDDCGYTTPNSFYKAYKRRYREAPLSLRKSENK